MKLVQRPVYLAITLLAVITVLALRGALSDDAPTLERATPMPVPRLVEFGSDRCVPCKAMQPVLAELRTAHAGGLAVEFVDVWKDRAAGARAGIESIPTQVFYDAGGRELYRHVGFISRSDIEAKFAELGVTISPAR